MRTDFDPETLGARDFYKLMTCVVVPRPIAWVATRSPDGVDNLAPHSFFTVAAVDPPVLAFTSVGAKDTLANATATGEFTVSLTPEPLFEQINATATDFPRTESEFDRVGVRAEPSRRVSVPRVAESPAVFECRLEHTLAFGSSTMVFGRVLHAVVTDDVVVDGRPDARALAPLARLGGDEWSTLGEIREVGRIRYGDWPGHYGDR